MYKSLLNSNFNVKKIIIGHICYSKLCSLLTQHTKFRLNKKMPESETKYTIKRSHVFLAIFKLQDIASVKKEQDD